MIEYDPPALELLRRRMNGIFEAVKEPDFLAGKGIGNNYPSFVFDYAPAFDPFIERSIQDLLSFMKREHPGVQTADIHLFDFARKFLQEKGKWEKSLKMEKGPNAERFLFGNLPRMLNGDNIAEAFFQNVMVSSPCLILIHGVGTAWPILRAHEVLKNLPRRMPSRIPIILFYPGEYDGQFLRPLGTTAENNEYQAIRWAV